LQISEGKDRFHTTNSTLFIIQNLNIQAIKLSIQCILEMFVFKLGEGLYIKNNGSPVKHKIYKITKVAITFS